MGKRKSNTCERSAISGQPESQVGFGVLIARQFAFALTMLRDAVNQCPDEQWTAARDDLYAPARLCVHILTSTQHYCRRPGAKVRVPQWASRKEWDAIPRSKLPNRRQILGYLDQVAQQVRQWLTTLTDAELLLPDGRFKWTGNSRAARALYTLRHVHHHLGQLNAELRLSGCTPAAWLRDSDLPCDEG